MWTDLLPPPKLIITTFIFYILTIKLKFCFSHSNFTTIFLMALLKPLITLFLKITIPT